jgi:hypothetical protein
MYEYISLATIIVAGLVGLAIIFAAATMRD